MMFRHLSWRRGKALFQEMPEYFPLRGLALIPRITIRITSLFLCSQSVKSVGIYSIANRLKAIINPENTIETVEHSLIRMFIEGPEVSLNGSPTVSPTTAALC